MLRTIIGDMIEKESHGVEDLMEMESGKQNTQPHLLAMWSSSHELTDVGELYSFASAVEIYTLALTFTLPLSSRACLLALEPISDHLGKKSYMEDEVTRLPSSPREDSSSPESSLLGRSFLRLPEEGETIMSACLSEVAFYEAAFHAAHPQRVAQCCMRDSAVAISQGRLFSHQVQEPVWPLQESKAKYSRWLYFRGYLGKPGAPRVPRSWGIPGKRYNKVLAPFKDEHNFLNNILSSVEGGNLYSVKVVLSSKTFCKSFGLLSKPSGV
ncbi:hypothetical protein Acr_11g0008130 [Actinidia rufa]|uniref:Uncharacterized protein n=1 Tax=Actinidia rufa TaxID=165716 RepID=A0A7J0FF38_9ERIC|nr:hypothetical protein Acr_11g0008130 [Actinidia rufa]